MSFEQSGEPLIHQNEQAESVECLPEEGEYTFCVDVTMREPHFTCKAKSKEEAFKELESKTEYTREQVSLAFVRGPITKNN